MDNTFDMTSLNNLIKMSQEKMSCDSTCQQQQLADQYKQDYVNAKANLETAPYEVDSTRQMYITFTQGSAAYNEEKMQKLKEQASVISNAYQENYNNSVAETMNNIQMYSSLMANYSNVQELYTNYLNTNSSLASQLNNSTSAFNTNNRMTFYENQQIDFLNFIYSYILLILYVIIVVSYVIIWILYPSPYNWKIKLIVFIFLIILPFISTWLLSIIVYFCYKIYTYLPNNVYLNASNNDKNFIN